MYDGIYDMWLSRVSGVSIRKFDALMSVMGSAERVYNASDAELRAASVLDERTTEHIIADKNDSLLDSYIKELRERDMRFISRYDERYPEYLDDISSSPVGIYVVGALPDDNRVKISVIGSRRCSEYGTSTAYRLSRDLAARGVVIVSGMARGIDSQAHIGALDAGGLTIAVLGCGADMCYPPENRALKERIIKNGCVVSEYPPGTHSMPAYFPARNRIISGLSRAVIVVEATSKSGTKITVDQALDQGREVFSVPGNITSRLSQGTNDFIKQGAVAITGYEDVFDHLGIEYIEPGEDVSLNKKAEGLTGDEKSVFSRLTGEPADIDGIARMAGLSVQRVNTALVLLEMDGLVKKLPGLKYIRL